MILLVLISLRFHFHSSSSSDSSSPSSQSLRFPTHFFLISSPFFSFFVFVFVFPLQASAKKSSDECFLYLAAARFFLDCLLQIDVHYFPSPPFFIFLFPFLFYFLILAFSFKDSKTDHFLTWSSFLILLSV